jgi:short-subunit dehydrogenase
MRPLAGKTALVTGAARGIGRAIALRLAAKGVRLALADRDAARLALTVREVEGRGVETFACDCELTDPASVDELAGAMLRRWAGVDLLVNNAGVAHYGPVHAMTEAQIDGLLAVNFHAPIRLTHALLPSLLARPESHVLNVGSVLGLAVMPKVALYCASKHGLVGFSETLRVEYGRWGLGVTTLCPGFVRTALIDAAPAAGMSLRQPPRVLCVTPDQIARAAVAGIEWNRRRVVVDPVGRWLRGAMALAPGVFDWMNSLGRSKRIAQKRAELEALSADPEEALRMKLGIAPERTPLSGKPLAA